MQRVTITIDYDLVREVDDFMRVRGYGESLRGHRRSRPRRSATIQLSVCARSPLIATLSYVYEHAARTLPQRLTHEFHDHQDLAQATLHVHLDQENCLEVTVLRGRSQG